MVSFRQLLSTGTFTLHTFAVVQLETRTRTLTRAYQKGCLVKKYTSLRSSDAVCSVYIHPFLLMLYNAYIIPKWRSRVRARRLAHLLFPLCSLTTPDKVACFFFVHEKKKKKKKKKHEKESLKTTNPGKLLMCIARAMTHHRQNRVDTKVSFAPFFSVFLCFRVLFSPRCR